MALNEIDESLVRLALSKVIGYLFPFTPRTIREANISALVSASAQKM
jgi:hypothetical protein